MKKSKLKKAKEKVKTWWSEHKTFIKIGGVCLSVGLVTGYLKGHVDTVDLFLKNGTWEPDGPNDEDFVYDESNVDDPDLLELIKQEQETTTD